MTENLIALRAPRWRVLLNTLALCGALLHLSSAHAASALAIGGTPAASVNAGSTFTFKPSISGGTGKTVYFGITNKPAWAGFSTVSGTLTGTPTAANAGTTSGIVIQATNGTQWASTAPFAVKVVTTGSSSTPPASSGALHVSGTPAASVTAGSTFTFKPTVSGGTGKTVSFGITNKPSWAGFSTMSGTLTGTPSASNVGTTSGIVIQATNGTQWASTAAFAIKVVASGGSSSSTVTISGTPATAVTAGSKYSFQPSAKDSAGKALSYSVHNAPSWASFSIASGLLSGTPTSSQTGVYSGIIISASDGTASGALPAFAVTVRSLVAATGSATLSWVDPTKNTDGSALTNMAGVNIHYGTSPSSLTQLVQVSGTGLSTYTISNLGAGTWYFGAAAYTSTGIEGMMSPIESKAIP